MRRARHDEFGLRYSAHHGGEPSGLIVCECLQAFKRQISALQLPLVVLLEQQRAAIAAACSITELRLVPALAAAT